VEETSNEMNLIHQYARRILDYLSSSVNDRLAWVYSKKTALSDHETEVIKLRTKGDITFSMLCLYQRSTRAV
ncbi:MAG: hypothetical protein KFF68_18485, partial [Desulfosarcina sp.]|nr:hypothetical protein [Desulfosarcina sp.]